MWKAVEGCLEGHNGSSLGNRREDHGDREEQNKTLFEMP